MGGLQTARNNCPAYIGVYAGHFYVHTGHFVNSNKTSKKPLYSAVSGVLTLLCWTFA